jgi:hypothetical protein
MTTGRLFTQDDRRLAMCCCHNYGHLLDGGLRDGGWMGEGRPKGGHALAILPGLTHYNIFSSPLFAAATLAFLDKQPS